MKFKLISLKRTPDRLQEFIQHHPDFEFELFEAIEGQQLDVESLVHNRTIMPYILNMYKKGALGSAMSHISLWKECAQGNEWYTVIEDDAFLCKNFKEIVEKVQSETNNCDFIFWGTNVEAPFNVEILSGVATANIVINNNQLIQHIEKWPLQTVFPQLFPVLWAIGIPCYSIHPRSAQYLLDNCLPIRVYDNVHGNYGIDHSILHEVINQNMRAYISVPPIALTKNDVANSTNAY